ncbi:TadE/TadG family type IV pilus assembly protein [Streptomyces rhizosphaericus]|uniref:Pilus assembly protein n=1 Tax=Streptomyces rhizosphaericus TaxID=114699 RepID=A0A6G4AE10_9ACTN|nr:TadE/TadG family type IV pilus assembly protein [Streptomyces rhizosphaericus]NEW71064.1 pilus assembly protein [Streptomyces rhizosphaericus]
MDHLLHRRRGARSDGGSAATQLVIVVPALLMLALLVVQFALAWHARHIAQYAAERALAAARVQHGSPADGRGRGLRALAQFGNRVLTSPSVTVHRTSTRATVRVQGAVMPVVPGLHLTASGIASGAVERVTTPAGDTP